MIEGVSGSLADRRAAGQATYDARRVFLDLRPVHHRLEERIRAHVILCWLALLLIRVAENHTGQAWPAMRRELQRISIGTFTGPVGTFRQRTEIPGAARDLLTARDIDVPRAHHTRDLIRALLAEPPPRDTACG